MARPDLKLIDESYVPPENATPEQLKRGTVASLVREGARRELERLGDTIHKATASALQPVRDAHAAELDRLARTIGKAAHRDGALQGIFAGITIAILIATGAWLFLLKDIVMTNTAMQRVNYAPPPVLQNEHTQDAPYTRQGCEPGACGR